MSDRAINPAHIQYDIKVVILLGVLDVGLKLYFWQDLHQNRLSNAVSKAWMTAGGLAAQQHGWWLWTMQKATCTLASALTAAPLAAGGDAKRTNREGLSTEHCSEENIAEPRQ